MPKGKAHRWTPEMEQFIRENSKGVMYKDLAAMLKEKFDFDVHPESVSRKCLRMGCPNGIDGRLQKGNVPYNKGKKGQYAPGCEKSWFMKGHIPKNYRPVGSERVNVDGYIEIKIADPNKWRLKHQFIWENAHGDIPKQHAVIFKDGNKLNCVDENLQLVHKRELLVMNRHRLTAPDAEIMSAGLQTAKLIIAIENKRKKS